MSQTSNQEPPSREPAAGSPTGLLDAVLSHPEVVIEVAPEVFRFVRGERNVSVATQVFVSRAEDSTRVVGFSNDPPRHPNVAIAGLFSRSPSRDSEVRRFELLDALLRHGFARLWEGPSGLRRPLVVIQGAESLDPILHGWQYDILREALLRAGALTVRFADGYSADDLTPERPKRWRLVVEGAGLQGLLGFLVFLGWLAVAIYNWWTR